jgi:hydroxymethylpyrimidine pyrophosphatase-like HAD family hydrolase
MNTSRPTNDKLFIFDVNPSNDDVTKELVIGNFSRVVKNLSDYQNVVFLSHSNLSLMKKLIEDIGIKNGFVISDNGSRIYDIDKGTIVYENFINKSDVLAGLHLGIMENCLVLLSGSNKEYAYSANIMSALTLSKKHYAALP